MLAYILFLAVKSDLESLTIPDNCSIAICILAVGLGGFSLNQLCLAVVILLLFSLVMGMGDAKLLASLSLLLGHRICFVILASFALSLVYCLCGLLGLYKLLGISDTRLGLSDHIPFAPFVAVPAVAVHIAAFLSEHLTSLLAVNHVVHFSVHHVANLAMNLVLF